MATIIKSELFGDGLVSRGYRFGCKYTFDDDHIEARRYYTLADKNAAIAWMATKKDKIEEWYNELLADKTINQGLPITNKTEARQYLKRAMSEDTCKAYTMLKKANDYIIFNGWTNAQVKAQLNITDEQWNTIKTRYQYLSANGAIITAYDDLEDPRGDV